MVSVAGHFGEWIQGCVGDARHVALITMTCPVAKAHATLTPAPTLTIDQDTPVLDDDRCCRFLKALDLPAIGHIRLRTDVAPGGGLGMSTAALVALARAAHAPEDRIAAACLKTEGATDPLMLSAPDQVLWAPRSARVLKPMPPPPEAEIVGGLWGPLARTNPADEDFPQMDDLIEAWANAADLANAAALASQSAERTTELRGPADDPTAEIARAQGALGHARAHTGPARALIFAPGTAPRSAEAVLASAGYHSILRFRTGGSRP